MTEIRMEDVLLMEGFRIAERLALLYIFHHIHCILQINSLSIAQRLKSSNKSHDHKGTRKEHTHVLITGWNNFRNMIIMTFRNVQIGVQL